MKFVIPINKNGDCDMYILKGIKVFDLDNPNCKIANDIQDICNMFTNNNVFVIKKILDEENKILPKDNQQEIGVVINPKVVDDTTIVGDIIIRNDNLKYKGILKNYEMFGHFNENKEYIVENIFGVEIE